MILLFAAKLAAAYWKFNHIYDHQKGSTLRADFATTEYIFLGQVQPTWSKEMIPGARDVCVTKSIDRY